MAKQQYVDHGAELEKAFARWDDIHENGCNDPFWPDGVNLNLVRNHVLHHRMQLEENPTLFGFPEIYNREVPPEVNPDYMARSDEIRAAAKASLETYRADPSYQFVLAHREEIPEKMQSKLYIGAVLGYVSGLERFIAEDDLVAMRRHEHAERYLDSFEPCAQRMQEFLSDGLNPVGATVCDEPEDEGFDEEYDEEPEEDFGGMTMTM